MTDKPKRTNWHGLFARALEELLSPLDIEVLTEFPVTPEPPKADVVLLRRGGKTWTKEQLACLADGLGDTDTGALLLEFKYTESITADALVKLVVYELLYRASGGFGPGQLKSFLISSKTPNTDVFQQNGFKPTGKKGIYASKMPCFKTIEVVLLNEVDDTPHNAVIKCFSSRQKEYDKAFGTMHHSVLPDRSSPALMWVTYGIRRAIMGKTLDGKKLEGWTTDDIVELGRQWVDSEVLEAKGRESRQEGRQEEAASMLLRLLQRKYGGVSSKIRKKITKADLETLEGWSLRCLDAQALKDVFKS